MRPNDAEPSPSFPGSFTGMPAPLRSSRGPANPLKKVVLPVGVEPTTSPLTKGVLDY